MAHKNVRYLYRNRTAKSLQKKLLPDYHSYTITALP
jgi:hypothetical protein